MKKLMYLLFFAMFVFACENGPEQNCEEEQECKEVLVGFCIYDPIQPSLTEYHFEAEGGSITITTQGYWWFSGFYWTDFNWFDAEITTDPEDFPGEGEIFKIETEWFAVSKEDRNTILVEVQPNTTGNERWIGIFLHVIKCHLDITITQSAE